MTAYFKSRVSLVLQLTMLCSFFLHAQQNVIFGLRVGLSQSNIHGSFVEYIGNFVPGNVPPYRPDDKQGFEFAALGYYNLGKTFELNYGLGFIQKGGTLNNRDLGYRVDPTLNYLYIPVGVNFKPIQLERLSVHVSANFTTNIQLSSEQSYLVDYETAKSNKVIFGYSVGGFLRYKLTEKLTLQGDVQFLGDFNPFFTASEQNENFEMKTNGQVFSIGLVSAFSDDSFSESKKLSVLFRAGYVISTLHGSYVEFTRNSSFGDPYTLSDKHGFEVAALAYLQLAKPLYLVSGLGFIQKGGSINNTNAVYPTDVTLNYLSIPLGLVINPVNTGKTSLFFTTTLTNNVELSSEQEFLKGTNPDGLLPENSNTFVLGYSVGGAIRYRLNEKVSLQVDATTLSHFTPFYERELEGRHYEMKVKGNSFTVGAVYHLK